MLCIQHAQMQCGFGEPVQQVIVSPLLQQPGCFRLRSIGNQRNDMQRSACSALSGAQQPDVIAFASAGVDNHHAQCDVLWPERVFRAARHARHRVAKTFKQIAEPGRSLRVTDKHHEAQWRGIRPGLDVIAQADGSIGQQCGQIRMNPGRQFEIIGPRLPVIDHQFEQSLSPPPPSCPAALLRQITPGTDANAGRRPG